MVLPGMYIKLFVPLPKPAFVAIKKSPRVRYFSGSRIIRTTGQMAHS